MATHSDDMDIDDQKLSRASTMENHLWQRCGRYDAEIDHLKRELEDYKKDYKTTYQHMVGMCLIKGAERETLRTPKHIPRDDRTREDELVKMERERDELKTLLRMERENATFLKTQLGMALQVIQALVSKSGAAANANIGDLLQSDSDINTETLAFTSGMATLVPNSTAHSSSISEAAGAKSSSCATTELMDEVTLVETPVTKLDIESSAIATSSSEDVPSSSEGETEVNAFEPAYIHYNFGTKAAVSAQDEKVHELQDGELSDTSVCGCYSCPEGQD
jgi:predicted RNase H-like nuclease (RuvC/YqgF family)